MTEFEDRYKSFSNSQLMRILENSEEYTEKALEAVRAELAKRKVPQAEIEATKLEVAQERQAAQMKQAHKQARTVEIGGKLKLFLDAINPIQRGVRSAEKLIRLT